MPKSLAYKNILFCTDFSNDATMAFYHALDQAHHFNAKLHILHVFPPRNSLWNKEFGQHANNVKKETFSDEDLKQQALGALTKEYGNKLDGLEAYIFAVEVGSPDVEIIKYANKNNIDMILIGALGRPDKDRMVRIRTAANVSKFAPCQVMVIRSPAAEPDF